MDIIEFFLSSAGKWFSQRTSHYMNPPRSETGKTDLWIEILSSSDLDVVKLCEQNRIDASLALLGARVKWDGLVGTDSRKQVGSTVLVAIANPQNPHTGEILQQTASLDASVKGRYILGGDDSLTLITETATMYVEERLWFESPNLRMRTSTVKRADGVSVASFCSEIRMGGTPPAPKAAASTQNA